MTRQLILGETQQDTCKRALFSLPYHTGHMAVRCPINILAHDLIIIV
jgi:hypothetical protein